MSAQHGYESRGQRKLVVMAKKPESGYVKTRLEPRLGAGAASLYAAFLGDVVEATTDRRWTTTIAYTPDEGGPWFQATFGASCSISPQIGTTLSARLIDIFERTLDGGATVVVRNSDSPTLPPRLIADAFEVLEWDSEAIVLGPGLDGGYYLVGMRRPAPEIFAVTMSTASVLEETIARARSSGRDVHLLEPWLDVDTSEDLDRLVDELRSPATRTLCPRTVAWLMEHADEHRG